MATGLSIDEATRALLLLAPRMLSRVKRLPVPDEIQGLALAPRHLSMLSFLLFDGPLTVTALAERLEVEPTTVSLMVGDLSRKGIVERREDDDDRRRRIVSIAARHEPAIRDWLGRGEAAWHHALAPLTAAQRQMVVDTLRRYEEAPAHP
jgi:DNA-binding MarR family transcriptional regulator